MAPATDRFAAHWVGMALAVGLFWPAPGVQAADDSSPARCIEAAQCATLVDVADGALLPVYASAPLTVGDPRIGRALIVVHGTTRDGDRYFATALAAAARAGVNDTTLVLAPVFSIKRDRKSRHPKELYWPNNIGWKEGGPSIDIDSMQVGSFAAIDALIRRIGDKALFPNLASIVVAGHSAGGQLIQRYAAGQPPEAIPSPIALRYVVANPSSYLYFDKDRPTADGFGVPKPSTACGYNRYRYGLEDRNAYMARADDATLKARYRDRDVIYLLGERDTDPNHSSLDKSCAAMLQGVNRLERGKAFAAYMDRSMAPHRHRLATVPGAGHDRTLMFTSPEGLDALFGQESEETGP